MTAVYLINCMPSRLLGWKTPFEMLQGKNEFIVPPKVFGCTCFVRDHRPSVGKLDPRAVKCIFVGYSSSRKGYTCWCPTERRLFVSMDVTFRESEPYYGEKTDLSSLSELNGQSSEDGQEGEDDIDVPQDKEENQSRGSETITGLIPYNVGNAQVNERQENMGNINIHARQEQGTLRVYTRRKKTVEVQPVHQQVEQPQLVEQQEEQPECLDVDVTGTEVDRSIETGGEEVERSTETGGEEVEPSINLPIALRKEARSTARKPPTRYGFQHDISNYVSYESLSPTYRAFIASLQSTKIPKDWKEAKLDPKWRNAMLEELAALEKNKTWELVPSPMGKKIVSCKRVYNSEAKS